MNDGYPACAHRSNTGLVMAMASVLWMGFMLWGCLNESGSSGGLIRRLLPFLADSEHTDKWVHAGLHGVLETLLWWMATLRQPWRSAHVWAIALFCASFGGLIEGLQWALTATRGAEWADALANTVGAAIALGFWQTARRWGSGLQHKR